MAHHRSDIVELFDRKYRVLNQVPAEDLSQIASLLKQTIDAQQRRTRGKTTEFQLLLEDRKSVV